MKKGIVLALMAATIGITGYMNVGAKESRPVVSVDNIYVDFGIVSKVNYVTDTVTVNPFEKKSITFKECEDWFPGDYVVFLKDNKGTPYDKSDDEVLDIVYSGNVKWAIPGETGFFVKTFDGEKSLYEWYSYE